MKKRAVLIAAIVVLMLCVLAGVVIAATWKHWWWPVPSARVWIDGKPTSEVRVFHGADDRYLIYYPNRPKTWQLEQALVPGQNQPVDAAVVRGPFERDSLHADFVVFPFGVCTKTVPFHSWWMYEDEEGDWKSAHLTYQKNGFTFYDLEDNTTSSALDRKVLYRVEVPSFRMMNEAAPR